MSAVPYKDYRDYITRVRAASPLAEYFQSRSIKVDPQTGMVVCPFHPDTRPSLSINKTKGVFNCFGCHAAGDVFQAVSLFDGMGFRQAVDQLADRARLPRFAPTAVDAAVADRRWEVENATDAATYYYADRLSDEARAYLVERRGLPIELLTAQRIGWADGGLVSAFVGQHGAGTGEALERAGLARRTKNAATWRDQALWDDWFQDRIIFPVLQEGRGTFLSGRAVDDRSPKYLHQRGLEAPLYNEGAINPDRVVVTEGPLDALSLMAWEYPVIAFQGGVRASALGKLQRVRRVYACLDADQAGWGSVRQLAAALGISRVSVIALPPGQDPNDYYRTHTAQDFGQLVQDSVDPVVALMRTVSPEILDGPAVNPAITPVVQLLAAVAPVEQEYGFAMAKDVWGWAGPRLAALRSAVARLQDGVVCPACGTVVRDRGRKK